MMSLLLLFSMTQGDVSSLGEDASATGKQTIFKSVLDGRNREKNVSRAVLRLRVLRHCLSDYSLT